MNDGDEMDSLVRDSLEAFKASTDWDDFVSCRKAPQNDMHPNVKHLIRRAAYFSN
jgi:hypothetical protein